MHLALRFSTLGFMLTLVTTVAAADLLRLPIGDPATRDGEVPVVLDAVHVSASGQTLTPAELAAELVDVDMLLVGESHTDIESHRVQYRVIEELQRAGRQVLIGLEMVPYTHQKHLDRWVAGQYTEEGFLELIDWYVIWGYHWGYYRDLFLFAQQHELPMFAINAPRDVISAVRKKGFENLTEEEAKHIPSEIDVDSEDHLRLFKAHFDEEDPIHAQMSEEAWQSMLRAQCTWDATMGYNAVKALKRFPSTDDSSDAGKPILVVLTGSGHVAYGLGIERQAAQWFDGNVATLIPVVVNDPQGEPVATVQGSYADFVWGVPWSEAPLYPSLGISSRTDDDDRRAIIYVAEGSVAERAGIAVGDVLVALDDLEISTPGALGRLMAAKRWGDAVTATVERSGETLEIEIFLRRLAEQSKEKDDDQADDDEEHESSEPDDDDAGSVG